MAGPGGVRVYEPPADVPHSEVVESRPIDYGAGDVRQRQIIEVANSEQVTTSGHHQFGELESVSPAATDAVVTLVAPTGFRVLGFTATGEGDGTFTLLVGDEPLLVDRTHQFRKSCYVVLPRGLPVDAGVEVRLAVFNDTPGVRGYQATVFGEVTVDV